jgi:alkanesulfonate monooxygenase SsuD/methylene tetrahydromethanopterin reductase-like flavin-dependent oxidoreductase (luciferase family)
MKFGMLFVTAAGDSEAIKLAEDFGFDRAWIPDSQMIWPDCYVTMATAALNTSRIEIGTGVTNPATRTAPVTANALASVARIAPGRIFMGIGTGFTSMILMNQPPASPKALREHIRVVRALLDGQTVDYEMAGRAEKIQLMHQQLEHINLHDRIPIYVAANGPKAMAIAGELGDGWVVGGGAGPQECDAGLEKIRQFATLSGRQLPQNYLLANILTGCILRHGERLSDERVITEVGALVVTNIHFLYELWEKSGRDDALIPRHFAGYWETYVEQVESYPEEMRFQKIHNGHGTFLRDEERKYVTPEAISATIALVGRPDEIVEKIKEFERVGVTDVVLSPPYESQHNVIRDFGEHIIPHFR